MENENDFFIFCALNAVRQFWFLFLYFISAFYLAACNSLPCISFDFIGMDELDADGLSSVFMVLALIDGNLDCMAELDFCNGANRLKMLRPLATSVTMGFCSMRGDDDDDDGDMMWEALVALFMLRLMFAAFFCDGISMFVLHLVTVADTERLNGILVAILEMRFGDVGSEAMTGISLVDGSSLVNVF